MGSEAEATLFQFTIQLLDARFRAGARDSRFEIANARIQQPVPGPGTQGYGLLAATFSGLCRAIMPQVNNRGQRTIVLDIGKNCSLTTIRS
jgi:hypothetical protein